MRARAQDSEAVIRRRLEAARGEMDHAGEFDYAIINKDFQLAQRELTELIEKERAQHGSHYR
jgi:guanylate kinase